MLRIVAALFLTWVIIAGVFTKTLTAVGDAEALVLALWIFLALLLLSAHPKGD